MKCFRLLASTILIVVAGSSVAFGKTTSATADNAALRYWSAFSAMQDTSISNQQATGLNAVLDGAAPYDDARYGGLVEKNKLALQIMGRGTTLPNCDWGLDYGLGEDLPVEYVRKALSLGRLNVLYAFHLLSAGNTSSAIDALAAGLRFSRDVANGGSLFATLAAKDLLVSHLHAIEFALHASGLSVAQRRHLQRLVAQLSPDALDWASAAQRDLESLRPRYASDKKAAVALNRVITAYVSALNDPARMPALKQVIDSSPRQVADLIPNAQRVLAQKQDLQRKVEQARGLLSQ